jgi:hypothetical protein
MIDRVHEVSSLYRTFRPSFNAYNSNGEGRDIYIQYNNGGFWKMDILPGQNITKYSNQSNYRFRSLNHRAAPFKYQTDGSGRDSYISFNNGGLRINTKPLTNYHLSDFLRQDNNNLLEWNRTGSNWNKKKYLSKAEIKYNKLIKNIENGVVDRLYNKEKHKFIKDNTLGNKEKEFSKTESNWMERNNFQNEGIKKKNNLPKIENIDQNFIYDIDKINRYSAIKKFEKDNKPPVNDYLHFKNDIIPTANF